MRYPEILAATLLMDCWINAKGHDFIAGIISVPPHQIKIDRKLFNTDLINQQYDAVIVQTLAIA